MTRAGVLEFVLSSSPTYSALICLSLFPSGGGGCVCFACFIVMEFAGGVRVHIISAESNRPVSRGSFEEKVRAHFQGLHFRVGI